MPFRRRTLVACVLLLGAGAAGGWLARGVSDEWTARVERVRVADAARSPSATFEIELFARSPERPGHSTVCLLDGQYGLVVDDDGGVANRNSHVDFHHYRAGSLTAGIQGGDEGQVIDMGDHATLERHFGGAPLDVFRWRDGAVFAQGHEYLAPSAVGSDTPSREARRWLAKVLQIPRIAPKGRPMASAQVKPGHVYLVRIADRHGGGETVGLLHVVDYVVGASVKLRGVQL